MGHVEFETTNSSAKWAVREMRQAHGGGQDWRQTFRGQGLIGGIESLSLAEVAWREKRKTPGLEPVICEHLERFKKEWLLRPPDPVWLGSRQKHQQ